MRNLFVGALLSLVMVFGFAMTAQACDDCGKHHHAHHEHTEYCAPDCGYGHGAFEFGYMVNIDWTSGSPQIYLICPDGIITYADEVSINDELYDFIQMIVAIVSTQLTELYKTDFLSIAPRWSDPNCCGRTIHNGRVNRRMIWADFHDAPLLVFGQIIIHRCFTWTDEIEREYVWACTGNFAGSTISHVTYCRNAVGTC